MKEMDLDTNKLNGIVNYLLDNPSEHHESQIAEDLQIDELTVATYLETVKAICPELIHLRDTGDGHHFAEIPVDAVDEARSFLSVGGFNKLARAEEVQSQEKQERGDLKIKNLAATVLSAEQAIIDSKAAKMMAVWALVISSVALLTGVLAIALWLND
jgi:hypothetical protein